MAALAEKTRAELIEEYVLRDALSIVLSNVGEACADLFDRSVQDIAADLDGPLFCSLWPDEDPPAVPESAEHLLASNRGTALTAAILVRLTTTETQDYLRVEAARLAKLAADRLGEEA